LLDAAHGGTAFFDEIGELPLDMQVKLLRVLQDKEFRAIGGLAQRSSNFRIIAATNRNLLQEVEDKRFRQDLYFRLNVMKLRLAPLRERREDIPVLIGHFLACYGNDHQVSNEVMDMLVAYDWPGNVRELEHSVQQMVAMNSGPWLCRADLPSTVINRDTETRIASHHISPSTSGSAGVTPLAEIEKRAIVHAIEVTKGDRTLAAGLLGIGRTTLYRKLKEYGL
jgi:transcriptional regulator with PAS, ATPase and Fis domain